jgi:hypothetical protein
LSSSLPLTLYTAFLFPGQDVFFGGKSIYYIAFPHPCILPRGIATSARFRLPSIHQRFKLNRIKRSILPQELKIVMAEILLFQRFHCGEAVSLPGGITAYR